MKDCPFNFDEFILDDCIRAILIPEEPDRVKSLDLEPCILCLALQNALALAVIKPELAAIKEILDRLSPKS